MLQPWTLVDTSTNPDSTLACTTIAPSYRALATQFDISFLKAKLPFSLYVLGLAVGLPTILAVDKVGRKAVLTSGFAVFSLFTLGAGLSQEFSALIACRFFAGVSASPSIVASFAATTDIWAGSVASTTVNVAAQVVGATVG